MKKTRFLFYPVLLLVSGLLAQSQIVAWDFNGKTGNESSVSSTTTDPNLQAASISRGAGISTNSLANTFSSTGFDTGTTTLSTAITSNDYLTFAITAQSGYTVSLSTLDAAFKRSGTGPNAFQWQYSFDAFATTGTNIGSAISYTGIDSNGAAQSQISLSGISALQSFTGTATFRLYGWGATNAVGTFALGRVGGNDLAIGGSVTAVPEPSTYALILGGIALVSVVVMRRRQRKTA